MSETQNSNDTQLTSFTSIFCNDVINCLPDKVMRECKCGKTCIDHADVYTRFIGVPPLEEIKKRPEYAMKLLKYDKMYKKLFETSYYKDIEKICLENRLTEKESKKIYRMS